MGKGLTIALFIVIVPVWGANLAGQSREELQSALRTATRLERENRWAEARDVYLEIGRLYPRDRKILYGLERVHNNIDDEGLYLAFLKESFQLYPRDTLIFRQFLNMAVRTGEQDVIRSAIQLYQDNRNRNEKTYRNLYAILLPLELYDLAEEVLHECRKELNEPFLFSRELGDLYLQTGRYEQSLVEALNVLQSSPEEVSFATARIEALQKLLPGREAIDLVEEYIDRRKSAPRFLKLLSTLYVHEGELDRAYRVLKELAEQDPDMGTGELLRFVRICEESSVFEEGIKACRLLGALDPARKIIFDLEAAHLSRLNGRPGEAGRIYREVLEANPDSIVSSRVYFSLGEIALYDRHRPKEALEWFRRTIDSGRGVDIIFDARIAIMEALVFLGDYEEAAEEGNRADASGMHGDKEIEVMFFQGAALILAGRIEGGKKVLERVSKKTNHLRANDAIEALTWLEKDTSTDFAVARDLIELRLISRIGDHDKPFKLLKSLRKNASLTPIAPDVIYYQARTYRAANRFEEAIVFFDEIVDSFPDHRLVPLAEWEIADILWRHLGELDRAKTYLEQVILDHGDSIIAPKARKDLEEIVRKQNNDH